MKKYFYLSLFGFLPFASISQEEKDIGQIHGNVQTDVQYYNTDSLIGAFAVPEKMLMNGFANINYTRGNFSAGIRYESYLNALQGFPPGYKGTGIGYRYATYKLDKIEVTAGNFYEQFGSGMVFRTYESRSLGYDNAMDGFRVKYNPYRGVYLKSIYGKQRLFFNTGPGIVRGIDGEVVLNELSDSLEEMETRITLGGSFVSKFQADEDQSLILPENVSSYAGRINLYRGPINFSAEYVEKINDPSLDNKYIYKKGRALLINTAYSIKGFGASLSAKSIDNMSFRSDRDQDQTNLFINYLPSTSKQHTYNLPATLYPYAVQPNGEVAFQGDVSYKIRKKRKKKVLKEGTTDEYIKPFNLRKFNTYISINYSAAFGLDSSKIQSDSLRQGYTTNFFSPGKDVYFSDFNVELKRQLTKKLSLIYTYYNMRYDKDVIEGKEGKGLVNAQIHVLDVTYSINDKHTVRFEAQHLGTNKKHGFYKDQGNWATGLVEYTISPGWFFAILDQYNYGNDEEIKRLHYFNGSVGYIHNSNRFTLSFGRQRAGIFCVGGVCRVVPASNGISFSMTSTF